MAPKNIVCLRFYKDKRETLTFQSTKNNQNRSLKHINITDFFLIKIYIQTKKNMEIQKETKHENSPT